MNNDEKIIYLEDFDGGDKLLRVRLRYVNVENVPNHFYLDMKYFASTKEYVHDNVMQFPIFKTFSGFYKTLDMVENNLNTGYSTDIEFHDVIFDGGTKRIKLLFKSEFGYLTLTIVKEVDGKKKPNESKMIFLPSEFLKFIKEIKKFVKEKRV